MHRDESRRTRLRSFLLGGVLGASAVLAAARRRQLRRTRETPAGLAAFEDSPCFQETLQKERKEVL